MNWLTTALVIAATASNLAGCVGLDGLTGGGQDAGRADSRSAATDAHDGTTADTLAPSDALRDRSLPAYDAHNASDAARASDAGHLGDAAADADASRSNDASHTDATDVSVTYFAEVLSDSPLAYYRLDDTTLPVAKDSSGNGNDGTYVGGVTLAVAGALKVNPDNAVTLNGTNGYIDVGDRFGFMGSAPFSLEAWVLASTLDGAYRGLVTNQSNADAGRDGYLIYIQAEAGVGLERWSNTQSNPIAAAGKVSAGSWAHVVGTFDGSNLTLYVDGVVAAGPLASALSIPSRTCALAIGAMFCGTVGFFDGSMDEVAIYDHALTAARIAAHYHVGVGEAP